MTGEAGNEQEGVYPRSKKFSKNRLKEALAETTKCLNSVDNGTKSGAVRPEGCSADKHAFI
ncbi:hypothetical protein SynSYN20_01050 [Synechococcus sp. SYN20]|nr:hypothetical protein SynSYN20_01050 [Synechococcus sp. SYN20]